MQHKEDALYKCPLMGYAEFAECVGVTPETARNWVSRRMVETVKIGKRRLIDVPATLARLRAENTEDWSKAA